MSSLYSNFTLSSNNEFDVPSTWKLVRSSDDIQQSVELLANQIDQDYKDLELVLVAILSGGAYFMVDLSRKIRIPHRVHYIHATSYSATQQGTIKMCDLSPKDIEVMENRHILLVDELYDNGKTLHEVSNRLSSQVSIKTLKSCVALRKRKTNNFSPPDYCGIDDLPDVWYVGYGLDDDGEKRSWCNLWAVPKPAGMEETLDDKLVFE